MKERKPLNEFSSEDLIGAMKELQDIIVNAKELQDLLPQLSGGASDFMDAMLKINGMSIQGMVDLLILNIDDFTFTRGRLEDELNSRVNHACQHESDGVVYFSNPAQYRCVKCEEFYKWD